MTASSNDFMQHPAILENAKKIRELCGGADVKLAITLGSGVGPLADALKDAKHLPYSELKEFPQPTVHGHSGELIFGWLNDAPVLLLKGREHHYERGRTDAMKTPIRSLKAAGVETLMLTNAAGSLRAEVGPGSLMAITDHIFFATHNPLTGEQGNSRFVDMVNAYDNDHLNELRATAGKEGVTLHEGVYMWFPGPNFETPAEIRAAKVLGADAAGMSTAPECIIARHCGLKVTGISVITNLGAGMDSTGLSHDQTVTMAALATDNMKKLVTSFAQKFVSAKKQAA